MARGTQFTRESAERIARAVRRVESASSQPAQTHRPPINVAGDRILIGKANSAISKSSHADNNVSLWDGAFGSETDTGVDVTAMNLFGDVGAGKWVALAETTRGYYIIAAEC